MRGGACNRQANDEVSVSRLQGPSVLTAARYVEYAMHNVRLLRHYKIEPYIVFDGGPLPAKKGTEMERRKRREENLKKGKAFQAAGQHKQARECFIKCADVTPQMAFQFVKVRPYSVVEG